MPHPNIDFVLASAREYVKRNEVRYGDKVAYSERALMVKNLLDHIEEISRLPKEWKCICGEWVDARYPAHSHAQIKEGLDDQGPYKIIGHPPEIWTYEREPGRPTRAPVSRS